MLCMEPNYMVGDNHSMALSHPKIQTIDNESFNIHITIWFYINSI